MKIIQQDFRAESRFWFSFFVAITICSIYASCVQDYERIDNKIIGAIYILLIISLWICGIYYYSFAYEFKPKEVVVESLFGLLGKKAYPFKNLKRIEYVISIKGVIDTVNLYFEGIWYKKKVSISKYQADSRKVRLFLFASVENMEELVVEKQRRWS